MLLIVLCLVTDVHLSFSLIAKVRRLYDIANVLTSLGLIKKVHVTEERGRKPAFKWIGPVDFKTESGKFIAYLQSNVQKHALLLSSD